MAGLIIMAVYMILILAAPLYIDYSRVTAMNISERFMGPSRMHIFGTDQYGRDFICKNCLWWTHFPICRIGFGFFILTY